MYITLRSYYKKKSWLHLRVTIVHTVVPPEAIEEK